MRRFGIVLPGSLVLALLLKTCSLLGGRFRNRPIQPCAIQSHDSRSASFLASRACFLACAA
jgi:hypothetical protein